MPAGIVWTIWPVQWSCGRFSGNTDGGEAVCSSSKRTRIQYCYRNDYSICMMAEPKNPSVRWDSSAIIVEAQV